VSDRHEGGKGDSTSVRSLTVLMIARSFGFPDGMAASRRLHLMGEALSREGAKVEVLCTQANEPPGSPINLRPCGVSGPIRFEYVTGRTTRPGSFLMRRLIDVRGFVVLCRRLAKARSSGRPPAVYLWISPQQRSWYRAWVLGTLRFLGIPCVVELNEPPWMYGDAGIAARKSPLYGVGGVVAISSGLQKWACDEYERIGGHGQVIRVPAVAQAPSAPPRFVKAGESHSFLLAVSLGYRDLIEFVLESLSIVWESYACDLVLTGFSVEDPRAAWLRSHPTYMAYESRIRILGYVSAERLAHEYSICDALLAPLANDERSGLRFPSKIAEYLLSARPVITSNIGDVGMYLEDGETALVAEPDDAAGFAERMITVIRNPGVAEAIGSAGYALALREFDIRQHSALMYELFLNLAGAESDQYTAPDIPDSPPTASR